MLIRHFPASSASFVRLQSRISQTTPPYQHPIDEFLDPLRLQTCNSENFEALHLA